MKIASRRRPAAGQRVGSDHLEGRDERAHVRARRPFVRDQLDVEIAVERGYACILGSRRAAGRPGRPTVNAWRTISSAVVDGARPAPAPSAIESVWGAASASRSAANTRPWRAAASALEQREGADHDPRQAEAEEHLAGQHDRQRWSAVASAPIAKIVIPAPASAASPRRAIIARRGQRAGDRADALDRHQHARERGGPGRARRGARRAASRRSRSRACDTAQPSTIWRSGERGSTWRAPAAKARRAGSVA